MTKLQFYDVKAKRKFATSRYKIVKKRTKSGVRTFAVAKSPYTGITAYRIVGGRERG
ncbi:MAG: hypothetical protein ACK4SY_08755 [Pyrobaculum sp.]